MDKGPSITLDTRLQELDRLAADGGIVPSEASRSDFLSFMREFDPRRPALSMLDSGKLRAVWKNKEGEQLGLHFQGQGTVAYVIWYLSGGKIKREHGRDTIAETVARLRDEDVDLMPILWRD